MPKPKSPPPSLQPIPPFESEADERAWWGEHDSADHVDWSRAARVRLPGLRPSTTTISPRSPDESSKT